jgi:hypothetical protein
MRLSKIRRYVIFFASIPLVCVLLYLMFTPREGDAPPPKFISLVFLGYTNDSIGQRVPLFSISNLTSSSIQCVNIGPQTQVTNIAKGQGTNVVWGWTSGSFLRNLQPGEICAFSFQPPPNGKPWRLGVFSIKPLSRWQNAVEKVGPHLPARICSLLRSDSRRTEFVQSRLFGAKEPEKIEVR